MENKVIAKEYVDKNYIEIAEIKDMFKKINECKIRTDGKVNAKDYMIFGNTSRATGWFINLDYIEKLILKEVGYGIGEI